MKMSRSKNNIAQQAGGNPQQPSGIAQGVSADARMNNGKPQLHGVKFAHHPCKVTGQ